MSHLQQLNFFQHIKSRFGPHVLRTTRYLGKKVEALARWRNNLHFHMHCIHNNVTPHYLQINTLARGFRVLDIILRAERALISTQIHTCTEQVRNLLHIITRTERNLHRILDTATFASLTRIFDKNYNIAFNRARTSQKHKYHKLTEQHRTHGAGPASATCATPTTTAPNLVAYAPAPTTASPT